MKYVALLRGIGPGNPNMRNDRLRGLFEDLGFDNVQSVISTGNIIFESDKTDTDAMEAAAEELFPAKLDFTCSTIIRSQQQIEKLIKANPFGDLEHGPGSYLLATFFKHPTKVKFKLPHTPTGKPYKLIKVIDNTLFTVTDNTLVKTTDLMSWLEKQFGKQITSRTWNTANRIQQKL